jgi:glycosyltransferase involved in cell wall biosynthesis
MKEIRLSIVIPFYNVEKYIAQCLDSVYSQDLPEDEYEVICVNDCSPDNSRDIVLAYQQKHSNLKLIEHERNKKLGAARNTGFDAAQGKYVWFIDSDDFINENVLSRLLSVAENNDLEILQFSIRKCDDGIITDFYVYSSETEVIEGAMFLKNQALTFWEKSVATWSKIYSRSFLFKHQLRYKEECFFEDMDHTLKALLLSHRFKCIKDIVYFYRINNISIMNTYCNEGLKSADRVNLSMECLCFLDEFYQGEYMDIIEGQLFILKDAAKGFLYLPYKERAIFFKRLRKIDSRILRKYMNKNYCLFYGGVPYPLQLILNIIMPEIKRLRDLKRKIFHQ